MDAPGTDGDTALNFALREARGFGHRCGPRITPEALHFLLDAGAALNSSGQLGGTAIHLAAAIPNPAFLETVLARGGDPRHIDRSGYSTLTHACFQPPGPAKQAIIRRLHAAGASLDFASDYGEFPLGVCLWFGDFESLRLLLDLGADPSPLNWTALHRAVALGDASDLARLAPAPVEINAVNRDGRFSPWLLGIARGDLGAVRWLAEHGADLTQTARCGESLLHLAARFGHEPVLRWLGDLGADPDALSQFADTPLHVAAEWNHVGCARALLDLGAAPRRENHAQRQPVHAANSLAMLRTLDEPGGADLNAVDGTGDWPLKSAAEDNDTDRIHWLLSNGAEVDRTSTGETALHVAVRRDSREAIGVLLSAGANPNQPDVDGWTPLFGAASREAIHALLAAGADPDRVDCAGGRAADWLGDPILTAALRDRP